MQKGRNLALTCPCCKQSICFSLFDLEKSEEPIVCPGCSRRYLFDDPDLKRQLGKFEALCRQLVASEEILSNTSVGVAVGDKEVKIPYKLLLTRFNSVIDLIVGDTPVSISFRLEPMLDIPQ